MKRVSYLSLILLASSVLVSAQTLGPNQHAAIKNACHTLPLGFEPNQGQAASPALFVAHVSHGNILLTSEGPIVALQSKSGGPHREFAGIHAFRIKLLGSNPEPIAFTFDPLPGRSNYLRGNDSKKWVRDIPNYAGVRFGNVYHGVDMTHYGNNGQLEYDLVIAPGTDPCHIRFCVEGPQRVSLAANGDLFLKLATTLV